MKEELKPGWIYTDTFRLGHERGVREERARCVKIARDLSEELYDDAACWGAHRVAEEIEKETK